MASALSRVRHGRFVNDHSHSVHRIFGFGTLYLQMLSHSPSTQQQHTTVSSSFSSPNNSHRVSSTSTSSWASAGSCGRTSSYGSWSLVAGDERSLESHICQQSFPLDTGDMGRIGVGAGERTLPADHLIAICLGSQSLERGLDDTATETEDEMKGRFLSHNHATHEQYPHQKPFFLPKSSAFIFPHNHNHKHPIPSPPLPTASFLQAKKNS